MCINQCTLRFNYLATESLKNLLLMFFGGTRGIEKHVGVDVFRAVLGYTLILFKFCMIGSYRTTFSRGEISIFANVFSKTKGVTQINVDVFGDKKTWLHVGIF